ncbi:hypothetical protein ACHAPT_008915 [Fusarium lateritium]
MNPETFLISNGTFDAFDRLRSPVNKDSDVTWPGWLRSLARSCPLERLPPELLRDIFSRLEITDQIAVGLCSQHLWVYAVSAIREGIRFRHNQLSWAGTPIICSCPAPRALPEALTEAVPDANYPEDQSPRPSTVKGWARYWVAEAITQYQKAPSPEYHVPITEFWKHISSSGIPENRHSQMASCLNTCAFKSGAGCYLRSLTAKEYIRLELVKKGVDITAKFVGHDWLTLDILLIWLISWARRQPVPAIDWSDEQQTEELAWDFGVGPEGILNLETASRARAVLGFKTAGKWAGHRLDVVDEASEEMSADWHDRTPDIEKCTRNWLMATYARSLRLKVQPGMRKYWEYWAQVIVKEAERGNGGSGGSSVLQGHSTSSHGLILGHPTLFLSSLRSPT